MAVDTTIPNSSNNVGDDLSAIRENFELLASAQVVDEGSTSDGDYIRYENGWQVCFHMYDSGIDFSEEGRSAFANVWNFPQSFDNSSYFISGLVDFNGTTSSSSRAGQGVLAGTDSSRRSTSSYQPIVWDIDDYNDNITLRIRIAAIGRWK